MRKSEWIRAQISAASPSTDGPLVDIGVNVSALAGAVVALENGGASIFGMTVGAENIEGQAELAALARQALTTWQTRLIADFGDEGKQTFETIAVRHGVRLTQPPAPEFGEREQAIADRVLANLRDVDALTTAWKAVPLALGDDDELVCVEIGEPAPEQLTEIAAEFVEHTEHQLPKTLVAFWSVCNGVVVASYPTDAPRFQTIGARDLTEPSIWPVNDYGDHWQLWDSYDDQLFVFGEIADSGVVALRITDAADPEVVWIGRREQPVPIAASFEQFLTAWSSAAFRLQGVLTKNGVPGWGN